MSLRIGVEFGEWTLTAVWRAGGSWRSRSVPRHPDQPLARDIAELLRPLARHRAGSRLAIAPPESYVRSIRLEGRGTAKPSEAVRELLPAMLPFEVERAQVSLRPRRGRSAGEFLVAACDRDQLSVELDALWEAGWPAAAALPAGVALVHAAGLAGALDQGPCLLMDLGERRTTLALAVEHEPVYARDVALGFGHLVAALTSEVSVGDRVMKLSQEQAHALALRLGMPDPTTADVAGPASGGASELPMARYIAMIQPVLEQLVGEVRRTLAAAGQSGLTAPPGMLLLSGSGAALPSLDAWFSKQLGLPVTRLSFPAQGRDAGPASAVAAGLATVSEYSLDLQPASARQRRVIAWLSVRLMQAGVLAAVAVAGLALLWQVRASEARRRLSTYEARWEALQPVVALQAEVGGAEDLERRLLSGSRVQPDWLRRVAEHVPAAVRLSELSLVGGKAQLAGEAQPGQEASAEGDLSTLRLALEEQGLCRSAQLSSNRNESLVTFTLECQLP